MSELSDVQYKEFTCELFLSLRQAKILENKLKTAFYYVDPTSDMTKVYSLLSREIIIESCIEIEKLSKVVYSYLTNKRWDWRRFKQIIQNENSNSSLENIKIIYQPVLEAGIEILQPWQTSKSEQIPVWWKLGYNGTKHEISKNECGSYYYAINALAGLLALIGKVIHLFNLSCLSLLGAKGFQEMYLPVCFREFYVASFLGESETAFCSCMNFL